MIEEKKTEDKGLTAEDKEFLESRRESSKGKTVEERLSTPAPKKKNVKLASDEPRKLTIGSTKFKIDPDEKVDIKKIKSFIDAIESFDDIDTAITETLKANPSFKKTVKTFIIQRVIDLKDDYFEYVGDTFEADWIRIRKREKYKEKEIKKTLKTPRTTAIIPSSSASVETLEGIEIDTIPYDGNSIIITDKKIYHLKKIEIGGILSESITEILNGKLEMLYKVYDEKNDKMLFTFKYNNRFHYTQSKKEILSILNYDIYKGGFGLDIMKKVINSADDIFEPRTAKLAIGFDNGCVLPITEEEKGWAILLTNHYQIMAYKNAKKIYAKYTKPQKLKIRKWMKKFIKLTKMKPINLAIIIGWSMAAPFRKAFIKILKIFPQLNLIGERETGKSAILDFFTTLFYKIYDKPFSSGDFSSPSRITGIITSSTFPAHFEEVKKVNEYTISILKEMATNDFYRDRMKKDGVHIAQSSLMSAPLGIDTNEIIKEFVDLAYNSKSINLFFNTSDILSLDPKWLEAERILEKIKLFSLIYDIIKDWTNNDVEKQLESIKEEYKDEIKLLGSYPRLIQIFQIIMFGIKLFEKAFDIILEKDNITNKLMSSRENLTKTILQIFYYYCRRARDYEEEIIYSEKEIIIKKKEGKEEEETKTTRVSRIKDKRYINHKLIMNKKGDYYFTQENKGDFNILLKLNGEGKRSLQGLAGELREALPAKDKHWIEHTYRTIDKSRAVIFIKREFLSSDDSGISIDLTEEEKKAMEGDFKY